MHSICPMGNGYGQFVIRSGVPTGAHRVSYALSCGPIPAGMVVCHRCDNPPCVRPDHLILGTYSDNTMDMFAKGRTFRSRGMARANAKLTDEDVRRIRSTPEYRGRLAALAAQYGVSSTTIRKILAGTKWRHVV